MLAKMLDSESLNQSALNGYSLYKTGNCKKAFFQGISKTKEITSVSNVKCFKPIFNEPLKSPTVISFINGQHIKDLHLITKHNSQKVNSVKVSKDSSQHLDQNNMRRSTNSNILCNCPKELKKIKTKQINGVVEKKQKKINEFPEKQVTKKHLNHNFQKRCNTSVNGTYLNEEPKEYVYKSSQRIQMLVNSKGLSTQINNQLLEEMLESPDKLIEIEKNQNNQCARNTSCSANDCQTKNNANKTKNLHSKAELTDPTLLVRCEWLDCICSYDSVEELTNHVKSSHIEKLINNNQFVCLWRNCKFSNQPSCSFKWLSKHVLRHCDLKPFKCVIMGCDMTFSTQNGLARHVPTHFNESRVRRACVLTSETAKKEVVKPRISLSTTISSCSESSSIFNESQPIKEDENEHKIDGFVVRSLNVEKSKTFFPFFLDKKSTSFFLINIKRI